MVQNWLKNSSEAMKNDQGEDVSDIEIKKTSEYY
jgi:hypothetical protein